MGSGFGAGGAAHRRLCAAGDGGLAGGGWQLRGWRHLICQENGLVEAEKTVRNAFCRHLQTALESPVGKDDSRQLFETPTVQLPWMVEAFPAVRIISGIQLFPGSLAIQGRL